MSKRYKLARARGRDAFQDAVAQDAFLLDRFGLGLTAVDGALSVVVKSEVRGDKIDPWNVMSISGQLWDSLRPLLVELHERREAEKRAKDPVKLMVVA